MYDNELKERILRINDNELKEKDFKMNDIELYDALKNIWANLSINGDITIYRKILVLLDDMRYFLHNDLQIDYPVETNNEYLNIEEGSFDF